MPETLAPSPAAPVSPFEPGARSAARGGVLADQIRRNSLDWLDEAVQRLTGKIASPILSKVIERAACAGREEVVAGLAVAMAAKGTPLDAGTLAKAAS